MRLGDEYTKRVWQELRSYAAYPPHQVVRLGDYGLLDGRAFVRRGSLDTEPWGLRVTPARVRRTVRLGGVVERRIAAGASIEGLERPLTRAGLELSFGAGFSAYLAMQDARIEEVEDIEGLGREVLRRSRLPPEHPDCWDPAYVVITQRTVASGATLFLGKGKETRVVLEALAPISGTELPVLDLGSADARFQVRVRREVADEHLPESGEATPLFQVMGIKRRLFRSPRFDVLGATRTVEAVRLESDGASLAAILSKAEPVPVDELYVISDLHMGGSDRLRTFGDDDALGWLGVHLSNRPASDRTVCLVIAGDVLDFLAYETKAYFDPDAAPGRLEEIARANPRTFEGLRAFTRAGGQLVVMLGNHDLELAMPSVWQRFCVLAGLPAGARPVMEEGFAARVGGRVVRIQHGNDADQWNHVDYAHLRAVAEGRKEARGWKPNEGTALVIDQMNGAKKEYPFVDLLKPEEETVELVLLALGFGSLGAVVGTAVQAGKVRAARVASGRLEDAEAPPTYEGEPPSSQEILAFVLGEMSASRQPVDLVGVEGTLGRASFLWNWLRSGDRTKALLPALQEHATSESFDLAARDKWYEWFAQRFPEDADVLIVGHTHLAKLIERNESSLYVNSGTWMPLVNLPAILQDGAARFAEFFEAAKAGTIAALEEKQFVVRRRTVVEVDAAEVRLSSVTAEGASFSLAPKRRLPLPGGAS